MGGLRVMGADGFCGLYVYLGSISVVVVEGVLSGIAGDWGCVQLVQWTG
jgi:hypothetical protein